MTDERAKRRLAAILAADVAGYSEMMGADEDGTLAAMRAVWSTVFNPTVAAHRGRVFKTMGDGALVEFGSAVDAVECAAAIQSAMSARRASHSDINEIVFRIGLNLGDVISEGDDILGDGVNVAARLEAQAPRGGILISDSIHAQVRGKVGIDFSDAGDLKLKNIAHPVRAWRWGDGASVAVPAAPAGQDHLPSIAVLPFTNMSGDAEQEYFSDGISEDIITDLSKVAGLMVVARNSSFVYKGRTVDIREVGRDLGVTSVLEGSIRRAGNRVRITAQLIDTVDGSHMWAERYDRDLTDIFEVQDEVTMQIVSALRVTLRPIERKLIAGSRTTSIEAYDHFLRGKQLGADLPKVTTDRRAFFERVVTEYQSAIRLDPGFAAPHAMLCLAHVFEHTNHWAGVANPLELAVRHAAIAVDLDPEDAHGYVATAVVSIFTGDLSRVKSAAEKATALAPGSALAIGARGNAEMVLGNSLAAIPYLQRAIRLDKGFEGQGLHFLGTAYLLSGQYQAAVDTFQERIRLIPTTDLSRGYLASALGHLGQIADARRVWDEVKEINPAYTIEDHLARLTFGNPADPARILEGLRLAGLAE
jgi:adenylate cyclase